MKNQHKTFTNLLNGWHKATSVQMGADIASNHFKSLTAWHLTLIPRLVGKKNQQ